MIPQLSVTEVFSLKKKKKKLFFFTPVLMEWSVDIIMKFLAYPLNWSWFYCYVWLTARSEPEKKKDPFCLPPPPHTWSTSAGNSSLSNCAENVHWKPELCVCRARQCHSHPHCLQPPSLKEHEPAISPQKFTKSRTDQESQSKCPAKGSVQPSSLCLPFCFHVKTLLYM